MKNNILIITLFLGLIKMQSNWPGTGTKIDPRFTKAKRIELSGNIIEAKNLYIQLINEFPNNHQYYKAFKKLSKNSNNLDELKHITIDLANKNKTNSLYELDLLEIYLWLNDPKAEGLKEKLFNKFISSDSLLKKLIFIYISNGRNNQAQAMIDKIRSKDSLKDFYAFELAIHSMARMDYEKSLEEFLIVLHYNPKKYAFISERMMTFPNDTDLMKKIETLLKESTKIIQSKFLLSDLYYKQGKYLESWEITKKYSDELGWIEFIKDLINDNQLLTAEKIINETFKLNPSQETTNNAILLLAEIFEKSVLQVEDDIVLSKLFETNYFFNQSFPTIDEEKTKNIYRAIQLYDSIQVNFSNIDASYRLGEINYKIFGDYDKSFTIFNSISNISQKKMIRFKSELSKIDVLISKGNLSKALELADRLKNKYRSKEYSYLIKMKINQINFYNMDFDNVKNDLLGILKEIKFENSNYNNIIDIIAVLQIFDKSQEDLKHFSNAQFLLMQNKRTEAISRLESMKKSNNEVINELIRYQIAFLYFKQNNLDEALLIAETIKGKSFYSEKALIFRAEVNDYILKNKGIAVECYLEFIEKFPLSIYYDPIRLRLREIAS